MTKIQIKEDIYKSISLTDLKKNMFFIFNNNKSKHNEILSGELFMKISSKRLKKNENIATIQYMRMSGKFEIVTRIGYYDVIEIKKESDVFINIDSKKETLNSMMPGDVVKINKQIYTVFTNPTESNGLVNIISNSFDLYRMSPSVPCYRLNRNIVLDI